MTSCEFKGDAAYWALQAGGRRAELSAWNYPDPAVAFRPLKSWLAFYASRVDACRVGDERIVPQAGDFYGGRITARVVGPFKRSAGTHGW